MVVALGTYADAVSGICELHQRYDIVLEELCSDRSANKIGKLLPAQSYVLFDLNHTHAVPSTFGLNWKDEVCTTFIQSDIDFVDFNLPDAFYCGSEVILKRTMS